MSVAKLLHRVRKPSRNVSLADHMAALCDDMRSGVLTVREAADRLEDLTLLAAVRLAPNPDVDLKASER